MTKILLRNVLAYSVAAIMLFQSCKDDSKLTIPPPPPDVTFTESFDNYNEAYSKGWRSINKSSPLGRTWYDAAEQPNFGSPNYLVTYFSNWEQAQLTLDRAQFPNAPFPNRFWKDAFASQRASNGYVATSIACALPYNFFGPSENFNVSCWLVSPEVLIKNGDKIIFYSFCKGLSRLQLWVNKTNSLNVSNDFINTGDFSIKLLDIDSAYARFETDPAAAFPTEWTRFEGEVKGLEKPVNGRFGFRYYLRNQPPLVPSVNAPNDIDTFYTQIHKSVIGIDEVSFKSAQ